MKLPADTFPFLIELAANNNRNWFNDQKLRFKTLREELLDYIDALITQIIPLDPLLVGVEPKNCLFRIHKDARFSKDKKPYKTHFGIHIVNSGKRSDFNKAGFYLHIEPDASMLAGGAHAPDAAWLKQIRQKITVEGANLNKILAHKTFIQYFGEMRGEQLKRPPQGFTQDSPHLELLKYKTLWVQHDIQDQTLISEGFMDYFARVFEAYFPFQCYLNDW